MIYLLSLVCLIEGVNSFLGLFVTSPPPPGLRVIGCNNMGIVHADVTFTSINKIDIQGCSGGGAVSM